MTDPYKVKYRNQAELPSKDYIKVQFDLAQFSSI